MIITSIKIEDVVRLEEILAYLTEEGWVIPEWLTVLRKHVVERDSEAVTFGNDVWKAVVAGELQRPDFNCKGAAMIFARHVAGGLRSPDPVRR